MFRCAVYGEEPVTGFVYNGIAFEVLHCPETIWCGALGVALNCTDEPDIDGLLSRYQNMCDIPKREAVNPAWSCCISIDYWQEGAAPRGMMFAQQVLNDAQDPSYDVYTMPGSLYIRAECTRENAMAAFGREECGVHELFGVIKNAMAENGYAIGVNGAQEIEIYCHETGTAFAYVQAREI